MITQSSCLEHAFACPPESADLLDMMLLHFDEIVQPAIAADEIDAAALSNVKHSMSIHLLMRKKPPVVNVRTFFD